LVIALVLRPRPSRRIVTAGTAVDSRAEPCKHQRRYGRLWGHRHSEPRPCKPPGRPQIVCHPNEPPSVRTQRASPTCVAQPQSATNAMGASNRMTALASPQHNRVGAPTRRPAASYAEQRHSGKIERARAESSRNGPDVSPLSNRVLAEVGASSGENAALDILRRRGPRRAQPPRPPVHAIGWVRTRSEARGARMMPAGGTDLVDILLFVIAGAALIIVLGGGAFQEWRRWSDDRRIRKHLRN
jgi:hypothetical protein